MTTNERDTMLKAGRSHEQYSAALDTLFSDVYLLTTTNDDGLRDWLYDGDYRDMPVIDAQDIAGEWDTSTEQAA